jgi:hypothetical protein
MPVRRGHWIASGLIWFWIGVELINGIGHPVWTIMQRSYTPGVATAPILLVLAIVLSGYMSVRRS